MTSVRAMTKSVALIRGVGGKTAMKMAELKAALTEAGMADVSTLQVAGNVVFDPAGRTAEEWERLVHDVVLDRFGFDLAVIVRSHDELVDLARRNPYHGAAEPKWVMTTVLTEPAEQDKVAAIDHAFGLPDEFVVDGVEIFTRYEAGVGVSKIHTAWFERQLGVVGTARNANTIAKLIELTA
ncbi:MAG: DUF1697 domain-containing protein [Actinobacteria bacterium]|nr:DUF1697 domain-containing protein [Actinomycetota bacterium]